MNDAQINALIAEHIMGWTRDHVDGLIPVWRRDPCGPILCDGWIGRLSAGRNRRTPVARKHNGSPPSNRYCSPMLTPWGCTVN